jgi:hypothetical protein
MAGSFEKSLRALLQKSQNERVSAAVSRPIHNGCLGLDRTITEAVCNSERLIQFYGPDFM